MSAETTELKRLNNEGHLHQIALLDGRAEQLAEQRHKLEKLHRITTVLLAGAHTRAKELALESVKFGVADEVLRDAKQQEAFVTRKAVAEEKALAVATLRYNQTLVRELNLRLREGAVEGQERKLEVKLRRAQELERVANKTAMDMLYQQRRTQERRDRKLKERAVEAARVEMVANIKATATARKATEVEAKRQYSIATARALAQKNQQEAMTRALQIAADTAYARGQADSLKWQTQKIEQKKKKVGDCADHCDLQCATTCKKLNRDSVLTPCEGDCYEECNDCTDSCVAKCVNVGAPNTAKMEALARNVVVETSKAVISSMTGGADEDVEAARDAAAVTAGGEFAAKDMQTLSGGDAVEKLGDPKNSPMAKAAAAALSLAAAERNATQLGATEVAAGSVPAI